MRSVGGLALRVLPGLVAVWVTTARCLLAEVLGRLARC